MIKLTTGGNAVITFKESIDKDEFINNYKELGNAKAMGELYGVSKNTILNYAKEIGYVNHYRFKATEQQEQYVIDNYYKKKSDVLAKEIGCSKSQICKIWREAGLKGKKHRTYYINENFFEDINTPGKAYILGYLAADGCVYKRENHVGMLSVTCKSNDVELLQIINREMESEYIISNSYKKNILKNGELALYSSLQINSDKICNDLAKYNIVPKKTWIYSPIDLKNDKLNWHFIRGYFDGDGSVYKTPNVSGKITPSSYRITITCNDETAQWLNTFFQNHEIISHIYQDHRDKYSNNLYNVQVRRCDSLERLFYQMYKDSRELRLERKYNKFNEFFKLYQLQN